MPLWVVQIVVVRVLMLVLPRVLLLAVVAAVVVLLPLLSVVAAVVPAVPPCPKAAWSSVAPHSLAEQDATVQPAVPLLQLLQVPHRGHLRQNSCNTDRNRTQRTTIRGLGWIGSRQPHHTFCLDTNHPSRNQCGHPASVSA